jgi:hypothetical protein
MIFQSPADQIAVAKVFGANPKNMVSSKVASPCLSQHGLPEFDAKAYANFAKQQAYL